MEERKAREPIPPAFAERMNGLLGSEAPVFLHALEEPACRGLRLNPLKRAEGPVSPDLLEPIPWEEDGYYLRADSEAGRTILHEVGAFYLQEPCAMIPARVLNARPGERVLDLCAAPGGKSTRIGLAMRGKGLLICNEPVRKRAQILSRNIERMGIPNAVVTCAWPEQLAARWPEGFDAVMVDAPCSGEGMFRRVPESRGEWTPEAAAGCAKRQDEILDQAAGMLRPGGRMVYATCTWNPEENEGAVRRFLARHPAFEPAPFRLPEIDGAAGWFTCYPHRTRGEGQFITLLRKKGDGEIRLSPDASLPRVPGETARKLAALFPFLPAATHRLGDALVRLEETPPDLRGIPVLRAGLHLAVEKGKTPMPDHAAALSVYPPACEAADLDAETALRYLAGEAIPGGGRGWMTMRYRGLFLGWGKGSDGMIRNHYPKGLRSGQLIP